jgi:hypothetical protein
MLILWRFNLISTAMLGVCADVRRTIRILFYIFGGISRWDAAVFGILKATFCQV